MKPDLDLMLFDLAEAYQQDAQAAIAALQALLLDEATCQARAEALRSLNDNAQRHFPEEFTSPRPADFDVEIRVLTQGNLSQALADGSLSVERLAALTRDPDALMRVHQALTSLPADIPGPPVETRTFPHPAGLTFSRAWELAQDPSGMTEAERSHLEGCRRCAHLVQSAQHELLSGSAVAQVISLFAEGASATAIGKQTGLPPEAILEVLCEARGRGFF